ncbi:MAG: hypothetical protein DMD38_00815 [Gemmatimonadetes bacterium]|nr:MAG: hypothetical protein DMD38_00815 [Gemmatimonadota bacterium]
MTEPVTLVVSIDVEEDNWKGARTGVTVENVRQLPRLDRLFERLGVRPTYFTTYQVAIHPWAVRVLQETRARGTAEIGAHLHPWNTPPIEEAFVPRNTMLVNLPARLQAAKIDTLNDALRTGMGHRPLAFRAGRWAFGPSTAAALLTRGYRVDSSVTPFVSWEDCDDGPTHIGAPLHVYRLDGQGDVRNPVSGGPLIEVPLSWGYNRGSWSSWTRLQPLLQRPVVRRLRLAGIAARLRLFRRICLSPESSSVADMLTLSRRLTDQGVRYLHISWHSVSLKPGLTPYTATTADVERLYAAIESYIDRLAAMVPIRFRTVSEAAEILAPPAGDLKATRSGHPTACR